MPSRLVSPVLSVSINNIAKVDTTNVDNLFGMWTIFSKCADSLENGRRLENLSWRLWNRETFCVAGEEQQEQDQEQEQDKQKNKETNSASVQAMPAPQRKDTSEFSDLPSLSESVDSVSSDCDQSTASDIARAQGINIRPRLVRSNSSDRSRGRERHMTPVHLAKLMDGIREDVDIKTLRAHSLPPPPAQKLLETPVQTGAPVMPPSTVDASQASGQSTHSIVRGFSPAHISSSYRSTKSTVEQGPLAAASTAPKPSKKKGMFIIGSSSSDESSVDHYPTSRKRTSFREEVVTRTVYHDEEYSEDEIDESAIEDDDSDEWEDSIEESASSSYSENLFAREDQPKLPSRRSLLSTMLHQSDRAAALANAGSRSTSILRSSRQTSPEGPSLVPSPSKESPIALKGFPVMPSRPIILTTTNAHPPALSPRTTRRNMLATELTESLRQNLLWERKQKDTTAALKRRHTAHDSMSRLSEYPQGQTTPCKDTSKNNSWNHYFEHGLHEYHVAGW